MNTSNQLSPIEQKIVDALRETELLQARSVIERRNLPSDGYDHLSGARGLIARGYVEIAGSNGSCIYYRCGNLSADKEVLAGIAALSVEFPGMY